VTVYFLSTFDFNNVTLFNTKLTDSLVKLDSMPIELEIQRLDFKP
jgi:hypothetical protein